MRKQSVEAWECGQCGVAVDADMLFAWCDGCALVLCVTCLDDATSCDHCDALVCRHCTVRFFAVECAGCGVGLHADCVQKSRSHSAHVLCDGCGRTASAMWA